MRVLRFWIAALLLLCAAPAWADTRWTLVKSYPHDPQAFTEGLFYLDGSLFESSGQYGQSDIRQVRLSDGKVLRVKPTDLRMFGEGIVNWGDQMLSLTWQNGIGFRWRRGDFALLGTFRYSGEGWGLTQDGTCIIMSDGTPTLRFFDPASFTQTGSVNVTYAGQPVPMLNELEYVRGEILANVWMTNRIARIDPASGKVIDWIDLTPLVRKQRLHDSDAVLNGIAYDATRDRLFVTGKYWPKLYEIRLKR
ncbi:MAG: glutaminyl-peptide cyclotransferase [Sphingobium sp.]